MHLQNELALPCGTILKNRIGKSAMSENMSPRHHGPTEPLIHLYRRWADAGPGLIVTGNIMVDRNAIAEPGNVIVEDRSDFELLQRWAGTAEHSPSHLWPQLNHPGRQAIGMANRETRAPSAVRTRVKGMSFLFKKPKALSAGEIGQIAVQFGRTARVLKEAGFTGVQIHAAHGYLISQFLSPLTNRRDDEWGGSLERRARFLMEVYRSVRSAVGEEFPVGVKINSADFQRGGFTEDESTEVVRWLDAEGIDLVEISGGTFERPAMIGAVQKESTKRREAYFMDYTARVRAFLKAPLMLTGGFRTVEVMNRAIAEGITDLVGLARPFALLPDLPTKIAAGEVERLTAPSIRTGIKPLDDTGFADIKWHEMQLHRLGKGEAPDLTIHGRAVLRHESRTVFQFLASRLPLGLGRKRRS
jgi:2,4-dienoyl-CoA reductase-like NADH-dependent reductase (Old Yellow Enzyme family)